MAGLQETIFAKCLKGVHNGPLAAEKIGCPLWTPCEGAEKFRWWMFVKALRWDLLGPFCWHYP